MKKTFLIIALLCIAVTTSAEDKDPFRKREVKFIRELHEGGRYFDCIAETRRLQISDKNPMLEYFIYSNYYLAGQYSTVISSYPAELPGDELIYPSLFLLSGSYLKKGMYTESYEILKNIQYGKIPDKYIFTMFLRRVEPLILSGQSGKIDDEILQSKIFLDDKYNFVKLREELQQYKSDGLKSPSSAAIMSALVPGLGQAYAGYPGEGIISLLSVAATAAGGFYMRESGRKGLSYTLFFFSGLFYGGNIYGAYNSAEACNEKEQLRRYRNITSQYGSYNPDDFIDMESVFN